MKAVAKESSSVSAALASGTTSKIASPLPWFWDAGQDRLVIGAKFNKYSPDRKKPVRLHEFLAPFTSAELKHFAESLQGLAQQPGRHAELLVMDYRGQPSLLSAECIAPGNLIGQYQMPYNQPF